MQRFMAIRTAHNGMAGDISKWMEETLKRFGQNRIFTSVGFKQTRVDVKCTNWLFKPLSPVFVSGRVFLALQGSNQPELRIIVAKRTKLPPSENKRGS